MQNINELIGIIKGIDFDGVINEKEIIRLQSWINKNKNLAYDKQQIKLINMVDLILEDHIIDDEERELMLSTCRNFLKDETDNLSHIYELNGIIEGIVCDGEVNEAEILRLKDWMDTYGDNIRCHKPSMELCKVIDAILEDGVITKEEQDEMLVLLNSQINNAKFENKLSHLCKLVKEKKNIGIDLIDILNNELAIHEIHHRAEKNLAQAINSYGGYCRNQEIIVVSLVLIAMLKYNGSYYDSVRDTYKNLYKKYPEQNIEGKIRSILSKYKKQCESSNRSRIINVALENAIVPQEFLPAFFDFIFDIYKMNFECNLSEDLYGDFRFVFEGLQKNILSEGDTISINVTQKTYKLISSTKKLIITNEGLDAIIKLSIIIVKLIDQRFWGKEVKLFNPYLKEGYNIWEKSLNENSKLDYTRKNKTELRSYWQPKFIMCDNSIYLKAPTHRVKSQYNYKDILVLVLNGDEEIYRNNMCDIREIIGGYQVNIDKIELRKPLGKLRYKLVAGNNIIYDSKDKLYRNYIVFNDKGKEIYNNTDFEGTICIVHDENYTSIYDIIEKEYYNIGYKLVKIGDTIKIGKDNFNFSSMDKPGIFGQVYTNCRIQRCGDSNIIPIYKDKCFVSFEVDKLYSKFEIILNEEKYKINDLKYKVVESVSTMKYIVELELRTSGIYEIKINQFVLGSKNKILHTKFAYDLGLSFSKELINESAYRIKVKSDLLSHNIDTEVTVENFNPEFIKFDYKGVNYNYYIPFDFGFYKLSGSDWSSQAKDIWIDDIYDDGFLTLYDSECDGLSIYTDSGILAEDNIKFLDGGYFKKFYINFLKSYKNENKYVTLVFTANGKLKYLLHCYNKCIIDKEKTEIVYFDEEKKVSITPVFYGKNKVFYELFDSEGEKLLTSELLENGQNSEFIGFKSFQEYTIKFYEEKKGLLLRKGPILFEKKLIFYSKEDFLGRSFKIEQVYFNQLIKGHFKEREWYFKKYYLKFTNEKNISNGLFKGEIYSKTLKGDFLLYNINPVDIEICSDEVEGTIDIYLTNQGDGLLFDLDHKCILNSMEHATAPDIFLFTINLKGEDK